MNKKTIENIFKATQTELKSALETYLTGGGREILSQDGFLYSKGTHPVLLVAHMDTVHKESPKTILYSKDGKTIMSLDGIGGDDRCGIIMILEILQKYDCSVVFLEDEEIGCVGARKFCKAGIDLGDINYAVEFDRKGGNDYVFYKDYNKDFEAHIKKFGFVKATGSCSDISHIAPAFKIEAVNISCGYYCPHCWYEYVKLDEMYDIIERATKMIGEKTSKFDFVEPYVTKTVVSQKYTPKYYDDDYYQESIYSGAWWENNARKEDEDPIWLAPDQVILIVGMEQVKFDKIYMDSSGKIYKDKDLKNEIKNGYLIGTKYHYTQSYWSVTRDYPKQTYKLKEKKSTGGNPYFVDSSQAVLYVGGKETSFERVFIDSSGTIYSDIWLTKKYADAELLSTRTKMPLDYADIVEEYPEQSYILNISGGKKK
jgi:hypothetical protein